MRLFGVRLGRLCTRVSNRVYPKPEKPGSPVNFEPKPELETRILKIGFSGFQNSGKTRLFTVLHYFLAFIEYFLAQKYLWPSHVAQFFRNRDILL